MFIHAAAGIYTYIRNDRNLPVKSSVFEGCYGIRGFVLTVRPCAFLWSSTDAQANGMLSLMAFLKRLNSTR